MSAAAGAGETHIHPAGPGGTVVGISIGLMAALAYGSKELRVLDGVPQDSADEIRWEGDGRSPARAEKENTHNFTFCVRKNVRKLCN